MTGHLLYPSVEIAPIPHSEREGGRVVSDEEPMSYETDFINQGEAILVVPSLASTTVSLDPNSGGWVVGSKSRPT